MQHNELKQLLKHVKLVLPFETFLWYIQRKEACTPCIHFQESQQRTWRHQLILTALQAYPRTFLASSFVGLFSPVKLIGVSYDAQKWVAHYPF